VTPGAARARIEAIDLVRGLIIILGEMFRSPDLDHFALSEPRGWGSLSYL
jgi:hypothetical protein